jgi:ABC-2 type transport system permease protein
MATVINSRSQTQALPAPKTGTWRGMATGVYTLWLKHMRKFLSSSMEIGGTLSTPILWMPLFGLSMGGMMNETKTTDFGIPYIAYITPGIILLTGLTAAVLGGSTLLMERVNGVIKEYLVAPIPRLAVLLGTIASGITKAMLQSIIVLVLGLFLGATLIANPLAILAGLVLVAVFSLGFVGIAAAVASKAKGMESYHALIAVLNLPLLFLSNALYPLDKVPAIIHVLALFNPTTYAVDATRALFYNARTEIGVWIDVPVLLVFMVLGVWYGYRSFQKSVANPVA